MDWYYPVLTGASVGEAPRPAWPTAGDGSPWKDSASVACTTNRGSPRQRPPSVRSRTPPSATSRPPPTCCAWTRAHRLEAPSGAYWTGIVYPGADVFPAGEHTSYTAAAVILAADAITGASPAADLFVPRSTVA